MAVSTKALLREMFRLHAQARAAHEHHVAYHALAGALHAAESLADQEACVRIGLIAREHGESIDALEPQHPLSRASAEQRGHESIFKQLAVMAHSARLRMQIPDPKNEGRPKAPLRKAKKRKP